MTYNQKQLRKGIKVESEHKPTFRYIRAYEEKHGKLPSDKEMQKHIAENHLAENSNYYKVLAKAKL